MQECKQDIEAGMHTQADTVGHRRVSLPCSPPKEKNKKREREDPCCILVNILSNSYKQEQPWDWERGYLDWFRVWKILGQ